MADEAGSFACGDIVGAVVDEQRFVRREPKAAHGEVEDACIGLHQPLVARQGITLAGWDAPWFQALLGVLLLVALLANGVVRRRLKAVPRS